MCYPIAEPRNWGAGFGVRRNNKLNCDAGSCQETSLSLKEIKPKISEFTIVSTYTNLIICIFSKNSAI